MALPEPFLRDIGDCDGPLPGTGSAWRRRNAAGFDERELVGLPDNTANSRSELSVAGSVENDLGYGKLPDEGFAAGLVIYGADEATRGWVRGLNAIEGANECGKAGCVNRRSIGTPYRRAKGTPLALHRSIDVGRGFRAAGGVGRA